MLRVFRNVLFHAAVRTRFPMFRKSDSKHFFRFERILAIRTTYHQIIPLLPYLLVDSGKSFIEWTGCKRIFKNS